MSFKAALLRSVSRGVSMISRPPEAGYRVLMYHSIENMSSGPGSAFTVRKGAFESQIGFLRESGGRFASFEQTDKSPASEFRTVLTFDDGYEDNLTIVAPILSRSGIPFTVFVATDFVQRGERGFLSPEQLKELAGIPGVSIGSHGKTHTPMTRLSPKQRRDELVESRNYLSDLLGREIRDFSLPHGSFNAEVLKDCRDSGYERVGNSYFGLNRGGEFLIPRTCVMGRDTFDDFRAKMNGAWDWYRAYQTVQAWAAR